MPDRKTVRRARRDKREGESPSTQAGEFVREEIHHIREGRHGSRSPQQAIAIGLSKARRAGIELKPPSAESASASTRRKAERDYERGHGKAAAGASSRRRTAVNRALEREPHRSASPRALAVHAHSAAIHRSRAERSAAAKRAARTKGPARRSAAARRAARTRARRSG
jgi:hypothetical protein